MIKRFKSCLPEQKKTYNYDLFTEVAPQYDRITKVLSFGQDARWKHKLMQHIPALPYQKILDIACGTGDITFTLAQRFAQAYIYGVDLTPAMIERAQEKNNYHNVSLSVGDMCALEQKDGSIDLITAAYALRNAPDLSKALAEISRVLRSGGIVAILDFSKPTSYVLQQGEYLLLKWWGSLWGMIFHNNAAVYAYIAESLAQFPARKQFHQQFASYNLTILSTQRFFGGVIEIIVAQKE